MKKLYFTCTILLVIISLFAAKKGIQIHGYLSQGYLQSLNHDYMEGTKDGTFQFNEFGINFRSRISKDLSAGIQITSKGYANYDNNKIEVDWAYGTYNVKDYFDFDAGILKLPLGMYNEIRDMDMLRTFISLPSSVYDERIRDVTTKMLGVAIRRTQSYGKLGTVRYRIMYGHNILDVDSRSANMFKNIGFDVKSFYKTGSTPAVKLEWITPLENYDLGSLEFGATTFTGKTEIYSDGGDPGIFKRNPFYTSTSFKDGYLQFDMSISTLFLNYSYDNFSLSAEYESISNGDAVNTFNFNENIIPVFDAEANVVGMTDKIQQDATVDRYGYYIAMSYRFTDWFELGGYYSDYVTDETYAVNDKQKIDPDNENYLEEIAVTARFDIGYNLTTKLEVKKVKGELAKLTRDDYNAEDTLFAWKITYSF